MSTPEENVQPAPGIDENTEAQPASELEQLQAALAAAEAKAAEGRDQALRAMAELENVRRRAQRDVENAHKYALEKFAGELVGVKDSLEMGLAAQNATAEDLRAGKDATLKLLAKAFEKAGVTEVQAEDQPFNPEFHEAMAMVPAPDKAPNTVINVIQKGYVLNGRLIRPARVIVAKAPE
ncbi:MAG: nucleotide exchange factor GrpE [Steroidobacteraceae bacterium]